MGLNGGMTPVRNLWIRLLVARLLATAALWVRIQISLKNTKMGDISKGMARPKNIQIKDRNLIPTNVPYKIMRFGWEYNGGLNVNTFYLCKECRTNRWKSAKSTVPPWTCLGFEGRACGRLPVRTVQEGDRLRLVQLVTPEYPTKKTQKKTTLKKVETGVAYP